MAAPTEADPPTGAESSVFGTWDSPLPAGMVLTLNAWEVTVGDVTAMTTGPDPAAPEDFAPEPGFVHVVAHVEAVRIAPEPGEVNEWDDGFKLSLMSNRVEVGENVAIPMADPINNGTIAPGGVVEGNMLVAANVPADAMEGAVLMVKDYVSATSAYVALP